MYMIAVDVSTKVLKERKKVTVTESWLERHWFCLIYEFIIKDCTIKCFNHCATLSTGYATISTKDDNTFLLVAFAFKFLLNAVRICALDAFSLTSNSVSLFKLVDAIPYRTL